MQNVKEKLQEEGREGIDAALKSVDLDINEMLGNNAEEIPNPPEDSPFERDPMDLAKDRAIERHMRGY